MKFETVKELAQAVLDGRRFRNREGVELFYDDEQLIPFRWSVGTRNEAILSWQRWLAYDWDEVRHWYRRIPDRGALCWVALFGTKVPVVVVRHHRGEFFDSAGQRWAGTVVTPVTKAEISELVLED